MRLALALIVLGMFCVDPRPAVAEWIVSAQAGWSTDYGYKGVYGDQRVLRSGEYGRVELSRGIGRDRYIGVDIGADGYETRDGIGGVNLIPVRYTKLRTARVGASVKIAAAREYSAVGRGFARCGVGMAVMEIGQWDVEYGWVGSKRRVVKGYGEAGVGIEKSLGKWFVGVEGTWMVTGGLGFVRYGSGMRANLGAMSVIRGGLQLGKRF